MSDFKFKIGYYIRAKGVKNALRYEVMDIILDAYKLKPIGRPSILCSGSNVDKSFEVDIQYMREKRLNSLLGQNT